jgi:hypothetical protein
MTNRVHPVVNAVQPSAPNPRVDCTSPQTGAMKLLDGDDAVLALGELRHGQIST